MTVRAKLADVTIPPSLTINKGDRITGLWLLTEPLRRSGAPPHAAPSVRVSPRWRSGPDRCATRAGGGTRHPLRTGAPHADRPRRDLGAHATVPTRRHRALARRRRITMMKPKTRQEMLRLVESIREKLDLALTLVALREAGVSQRRETKARPRYQDLPRGVQEAGAALARRHGGNRGLPGGIRKQVSPQTPTIGEPGRPISATPGPTVIPRRLMGGPPHGPLTPRLSPSGEHAGGSLSPRVARAIAACIQHGEEAAWSAAFVRIGGNLTTMIYTHVLNRGPSAVKSLIGTIFGARIQTATVLSALCDGISDGLGCEMSRDSTDDGRSVHGHVNGRPTSRFATIRRVDRTELRCDVPQVQRRYADRASPRPNCSSAHIDEKARLWSSAAGEVVYGDRS